MNQKSETSRSESVLEPGIIYSSDNGRLICRKCAGASASITGRDISGQEVTAMPRVETLIWQREFKVPMSCEGKCTTYELPAADARVPAVCLPCGPHAGADAIVVAVGETEDAAWKAAAQRIKTNGTRKVLERKGFFGVEITQETYLAFYENGGTPKINLEAKPKPGESARQKKTD